jgi:membrane protease YdiL (CAAX protease family)
MSETDATHKAFFTRYEWIFLAITFLFSWSFWLASDLFFKHGLLALDSHWLIAQIGVFGPSLTALLVSGIFHKELRRNTLRTVPFLLLPLFIPGILIAKSAPSSVTGFTPLVSIVTVAVSIIIMLFFSSLNRRLLNPGTGELYERSAAKWRLLSITFFPALFLLAWVLVNLPGGGWKITTFQSNAGGFLWILLVAFSHNLLLGASLGEEIGWRGFLLPQLLKHNSPLTGSLILGVVWALWHLPIDLNAGNSLEIVSAIVFRMISAISFTILFTWFYLHKGNLLVAMFLHTSINFLPDLGFSQYEASLILFVIFSTIAAIIVTILSPVFRRSYDRT